MEVTNILIKSEGIFAYNIDVANDDTYFVGNEKAWVHNSKPCGVGTYTNEHQSGKFYHGKGNDARRKKSAKDKEDEYNDPVVKSKFTPAPSAREAFKEEQRRINKDGGPGSNNYNKINSPGKKYLKEDKKKRP